MARYMPSHFGCPIWRLQAAPITWFSSRRRTTAFMPSTADASPCHQYWQRSFLRAGVTAVPFADTGTDDINKTIGITGTPVIDPATNILYAIVKTKEGTANYHQRLYAVNLADGKDKVTALDITPAITSPGPAIQVTRASVCTALRVMFPSVHFVRGSERGLHSRTASCTSHGPRMATDRRTTAGLWVSTPRLSPEFPLSTILQTDEKAASGCPAGPPPIKYVWNRRRGQIQPEHGASGDRGQDPVHPGCPDGR